MARRCRCCAAASCRPCSASPAWTCSAPQHCCCRRRDNFAAVGSQHANRGLVDIAEDLIHDAAANEADAIAPLAQRGSDLWQRAGNRSPRALCISSSGVLSLPWKGVGKALTASSRPVRCTICCSSAALVEFQAGKDERSSPGAKATSHRRKNAADALREQLSAGELGMLT